MVNTFHHRRGGDATYALSLARLLREQGHDVVPLAMRHPDNEPSEWEGWFVPWVDFRDLGGPRDKAAALARFVFNRAASRAAAALIERVRPDVVHLQHVHHHLTPAVLGPARRAGLPVVWTVHDYELVCPSGLLYADGAPCTACRGHRYHEAVRRRCKRDDVAISALAAVEKAAHAAWGVWSKVDRFLCPSQFLADRLIEFGVPGDRVVRQPNFLAAPPSPPPPPGRGWLYAGRLTEEKGLRVLIDAARRLPGHPLTICGSGPLEAELRERARDLPHVRFEGHVPASVLAARLAEAAVVAVPSLWWENLPYAVAEAQAAGRAVVASRIGGIPELIDDGTDGVLTPPGDAAALAAAVGALLAAPERAAALGVAGWRRVRDRLGPDTHVRAILGHYREVGARG